MQLLRCCRHLRRSSTGLRCSWWPPALSDRRVRSIIHFAPARHVHAGCVEACVQWLCAMQLKPYPAGGRNSSQLAWAPCPRRPAVCAAQASKGVRATSAHIHGVHVRMIVRVFERLNSSQSRRWVKRQATILSVSFRCPTRALLSASSRSRRLQRHL